MATASTVGVGDKAPDFTLRSGSDSDVTLSEALKENTAVLAFYVFDFTGG